MPSTSFFFHRELQCLVAIDLKIEAFKPEYLGKMNFYLEVLDRDLRMPHENPSIGVILCKTKDDEVVEIAMSRQLSPALVAAYQTKFVDKNLLRRMLHAHPMIFPVNAECLCSSCGILYEFKG